VQNAVADAARAIQSQSGIKSRNYVAACGQIAALQSAGQLDETELENFAKSGKFEETIATLSALSMLPIEMVEHAMVQDRSETVLIIAKAIGLAWPTVKHLLRLRAGEAGIGNQELEQCLGIYTRLKTATAPHVVDFQRKRTRGA
jgi:hypothetical protein